MSWINVQKAYDNVQQNYLIDIFERSNVSPNIASFVKRTLDKQQKNLICNKKEINQLKIEGGFLQGNSLSSLLRHSHGTTQLAVKSLLWKATNGGIIKRNHLIFIDDIKLLASSEENLVELCRYMNRYPRRWTYGQPNKIGQQQ